MLHRTWLFVGPFFVVMHIDVRVNVSIQRISACHRAATPLQANLFLQVWAFCAERALFRESSDPASRIDFTVARDCVVDSANGRRSVSCHALRQVNAVELVGRLGIKIIYPDGDIVDLGIVSERVVTLAAINVLVAVLQGGSATELQNFRYHATGTGVTAENSSDTALVAEVETREVGTQTSIIPGNYETVAQHAYAATFAITEHGIFSVVTSNTITLWDRSVFAVINLASGDSIQFTYVLTANSGG